MGFPSCHPEIGRLQSTLVPTSLDEHANAEYGHRFADSGSCEGKTARPNWVVFRAKSANRSAVFAHKWLPLPPRPGITARSSLST